MNRLLALLAAAVLLVLAGPVAPPATAATQTVMMQDYAFTPASLTVQAGDTVTWIQHDTAPHDVVTTSAPVAFRSPLLSQGQSWSYTFRTAGTYAYYCSVHPDMRAQAVVQPAPTPARPAPARTTAAAPTSKRTAAAPTRTGAAAPPANAVSTPPSTAAPAEPQSTDQPQPAVAQQAAAAPSTTLNPMLLVAGLVTAVAIGCLLALTSRKA
ncbi:cupredoxin family copper-binding protein [Amycolatopsis sp. NBC_00345]|uniref:cupredoxin domain-containing protein n=1 Tax=Amycolatopsis sp. NBC_00345 TaxID=2975955 RepID=UPI002E25E2DF